MTRRFFLPNPTGQRHLGYPWLSVLLLGLSVLVLRGFFPSQVQAQSGITSPASGTTVSGDVIIIGTAVHPAFLRYELYYKLEPSSDDGYIYFDGGSAQVTGGPLGIWRTTGLGPGVYTLRLRVVKNDSNYDEVTLSNVMIGQTSEPTPTTTPTSSEPTPTPIPTATFTPAPQPTAIVGQVTQPQIEGEGPIPPATATSEAAVAISANPPNDSGANTGDNSGNDDTLFTDTQAAAPAEVTSSFTRDLGEAVSVDRLRNFFLIGVRLSATLILGGVVLLVGKRLFGWFWTQYR